MIIGVDPGTTESAWVILKEGVPVDLHKQANEELLLHLRLDWPVGSRLLAIEDVEARGMPVGRETFQTVKWIGRFQEAWQGRGGSAVLVYRRQVKLFHCGSAKAGDSNIRAAIIDRYGGQAVAIGLRKSPGPFYDIKGDMWSALAIALLVEGKTADAPVLQASAPDAGHFLTVSRET